MSNNNFSVFDFAPKVVEKKARYRDEEQKKKHTYNFVTDPKMKRGHNFGVVYVTNSTVEDEMPKKKEPVARSTETIEKKRRAPELDVPKPPNGRENLGVNTSPVRSTIRPKPLTFEMGVQIDLYIDRPQTPLFWPQYTGEEKATQIEDGDLFHFDDEVEPILNVLLSKVLEQSRMEVLEEEEIKEMKKKQREFEERRNKELMEVQTLEDQEKRRELEINMRKQQEKQRKEITIINQKKLFSRVFAKEYLSKLKSNTLKQLEERGVFRNPIKDQYYNNLVPFIYSHAETIQQSDYTVINELSATFNSEYIDKKKNMHKLALEKEKQRKIDLEIKRKEEYERKKEERRKQREEAARLKKEKEYLALKNSINEEFVKKVEFFDVAENVFDINAYGQKKKYSPLIGGYYGQLAVIITYFNRLTPDFMNEEKLMKTFELMLPKFPVFNILYKADELDNYKQLDPNGGINTIEDILKLDNELYTSIYKLIVDNMLVNDEILSQVLHFLGNIGYDEINDVYALIMESLGKILKSTTDASILDKVKFLVKEPEDININYSALCEFNSVSISNPKPVDPILASNKKPTTTTAKKATVQQPVKATFDPYFYEKAAMIPTVSDTMKVLGVNYNFERMMRNNIIDCMLKNTKVEGELESVKAEFEEFYQSKFAEPFVMNLLEAIKKEKVSFDNIEPPQDPIVDPQQP